MRPRLVMLALVAVAPGVALASAPDTKAVEAGLAQWIGTAKDGWTPVAFAALRSAMPPAEVGQHFPGAERLIGSTD